MTKLQELFYECVLVNLPKIADALERIAKEKNDVKKTVKKGD